MNPKTAKELFNLYEFSNEAKLKATQFINADIANLYKINALCLKIKLGQIQQQSINAFTFIAKLKNITIIYKLNPLIFTNIHLSTTK